MSFIETRTGVELAEHTENNQSSWQITDLNTANWALRMLANIEKKLTANEQLAQAEIQRITFWHEQEKRPLLESQAFFEQQLAAYLQLLRTSDPKAVIKSPYGRVSSRKVPAKITYSPQAVSELQALGLVEFIRTKSEVNVASLKQSVVITEDLRVVTTDGQQLKEASVVPAYEKITTKVVTD